MAELIKLKDVTKEFNGQVVLRGIDSTIDQNEFATFLGPSGCGKTTTLRIIGGFTDPSQGEVLFDGKSILDIPAHKRPTNTVFQRYSLFQHLDVFEHVAFGLRVKNESIKTQSAIRDLNDEYKQKIKENPELKNELKAELKTEINKLVDHNFSKKAEIKSLKLNKPEGYKAQIKAIKETFV